MTKSKLILAIAAVCVALGTLMFLANDSNAFWCNFSNMSNWKNCNPANGWVN